MATATTRNCPKCSFESPQDFAECPRCGVVIWKYTRKDPRLPVWQPAGRSHEGRGVRTYPKRLGDWAFPEPGEVNTVAWALRLVLLAVITVWGLRLALSSPGSNVAGESLLHLINLPFHEAGHVFFGFFGKFLTSLGGTLLQLLVPLVCFGFFLFRSGDNFAAAVSLWWFGENFLDIAPYINDARAGVLPLLGGNTGNSAPYGFHDWQFVLNESGLLAYDQQIARLSHGLGGLIMLLAVFWAATILLIEFRVLSSRERLS